MHIAEVVTIAKSLPLLRLNTYKSLILSYSADYRRIFMKKHYSLFCTLFAAFMAMPVCAQNSAVPAAGQANMLKAADDAKHKVVVIDEDFSGFTDGTEDNPSTATILDDMDNFVNKSALKPYSEALSYKEWGGHGLFSAGGCLAIANGMFLNTPAGDMSGEVTLTFRARLSKAGGSTTLNALKLMFISRSSLVDYEVKFYSLTDEWQTFTYTSTLGDFEHSGFQFLSMYDSNIVLVDDIRLEQTRTSIPAPKVQEAENMTDTSFKAVWNKSIEADHYLLSVFTKNESKELMTVSEGFDNIKADDKGNIDATSPNYPEGWEFAWKDNDLSNHIAKGEGAGTGNKQAVRLIDTGDAITTPYCPEGIKSLKFWVKAEANDGQPKYSSILFTVNFGKGVYTVDNYIDIPTMFAPAKRDGYYFDLTETLSAFDKIYSVKIEYIREEDDKTTILFDDFSYTTNKPTTYNYVLKDQEVEQQDNEDGTVGFEVNGLDPDTDYTYSVKSVNSDFTSAASDEQEVYAVSIPTALPATNITANSYTANWTSHKKVDFYRVDQLQQTVIDKDTKDYVMLDEDFSKVTSSLTEADLLKGSYDEGERTSGYMPLDDITKIAGWKASSTVRVNGWLGGNEAKQGSGTIAGAIVTPTIDLSHNEGACNISLRVWGSEGDWLIIQGSNPASLATIEFPKGGGIVEKTITMPLCTSKEQLTFYSNNYKVFLIDYIKITQDVKAGDKVTTITGSVLTEDADTKSMVMTNPGFSDGHDVLYRVTAMRYDKDSQESHKYYSTSTPSDLMLVKNPNPSGIGSVEAPAENVAGVEGGIVVNAANATTVNVFNLSGQLVASKACGNGHAFVSVAPGVYVVKTNSTAAKVVVK